MRTRGMRTYDRWSSLFWLAFSVYVCVASLQIGIGRVRRPEMGFMAFGCSVLLGLLALSQFARTFLKGDQGERKQPFAGLLWKRLLLVVVVLVLYAFVMPSLGYLISTFLLMTFLFWILERRRVWLVLTLSTLATLATHFVFSVWLKGQFPEGPFGF
jgi:putative tricarboxylic transport membrane protein